MGDEWWVLLVYDGEGPVQQVARILLDQEMKTRRVRSCHETKVALQESSPPSLILTDISLPDGTWADVVNAASTGPANAAVIVVSRLVDMNLYCEVLESGAHDFIVPPLSFSDLAHIIEVAIAKGSGHRLYRLV